LHTLRITLAHFAFKIVHYERERLQKILFLPSCLRGEKIIPRTVTFILEMIQFHPVSSINIPSPDWSRGLVTDEAGEEGTWSDTHGWSKFAGANGATAGLGAIKVAGTGFAAITMSELPGVAWNGVKSVGTGAWNGVKNARDGIKSWWNRTPKPSTPATPTVTPSTETVLKSKTGVSNPGKISGAEHNQLIETGTPLKDGSGWVQRWIRISDADYVKYRMDCADELDRLYEITRKNGMSGEAARQFHFEQMQKFRSEWLKNFFNNRDY
jgi:hypothetical protein